MCVNAAACREGFERKRERQAHSWRSMRIIANETLAAASTTNLIRGSADKGHYLLHNHVPCRLIVVRSYLRPVNPFPCRVCVRHPVAFLPSSLFHFSLPTCTPPQSSSINHLLSLILSTSPIHNTTSHPSHHSSANLLLSFSFFDVNLIRHPFIVKLQFEAQPCSGETSCAALLTKIRQPATTLLIPDKRLNSRFFAPIPSTLGLPTQSGTAA